ncbi:hypothetical protein Poli38472_014210 [Pythium oligandrum]|uniref:Uncharacterized protein n=1 Tax=Pythium oligandrum TaxID=41045 RepID=A0A8K1FMY2_PYTOL|nr:hypothetical protein Poli38472_014210 [Pythium oligandrum]|eukprot:TMW64093.1 hypothetical protein Poli38472_014210 [Pythium oligandrum]
MGNCEIPRTRSFGMTTRSTTRSTVTEATRTSSESDDEVAVASPKRKKTYKSTYYSRKSEISSLQSQIEALTQQLQQMQSYQPVKEVQRAVSENALLYHQLQDSGLVLARTQSLVLGEMATNPRNPMDMNIRLSADPFERRQTLNTLKTPVVDCAVQYVLERTRFLRLDQNQRQTHNWTDPNGDHVFMQCDVTPFPTVSDIQHAFESLCLAISHQEFQFWEHLGVLTVCEAEDPDDAPVKQARYISATALGVGIDKNMLKFRAFMPSSRYLQEPHGVLVIQTPDEDALYPYQPQDRVRIDVSAIVLVRPIQREDGSKGVTIVRWAMTRMHRPQYSLTYEQERELEELIPRWGEVVRRAVQDYIHRR